MSCLNNIRVSIIIPAYNSAEWIEECLKSIPKRPDIEIICIDDGSTDNTHKKIVDYMEEYDRIGTLINLKENKGVSYARNQGINEAKGEYILMLDSDDYIYPDVFNDIVDNYLDKTYDLVFYNIEGNNMFVYNSTRENYTRKYGNFKFIKREFLGDLRYTVGKQYAEDKELHLKLISKFPRCVFTKKVMYHYNYPRKGSLSAIGEHR